VVLATGQVDIFKINREELALLVQEIHRATEQRRPTPPSMSGVSAALHGVATSAQRQTPPSLAASAASPALSDRYVEMSIPELARILLKTHHIKLLGVTNGPDSNTSNGLCDANHRKEHDAAELLLNPLGAGDTASAVFLMDYIDTRDPVESFKRAIAAASASCLVTEQTAHFDVSIMEWISERIQVREVKTAPCAPPDNACS
ncbi:hypothetical protein SYNPS1DRAFT_23293, partial [Syncephalis pseudoplumigaleata]